MEAGGQGSDQLWKTLGSGPGPVAPFSALLTPQAPLGALPGAPGPRPPRGVGSWCGWLCAKGRISPSSRALLALQPPLPPHLLQHRSGTVWKRGPLRRRGVRDRVGTPWCWQCLQGGRGWWWCRRRPAAHASLSLELGLFCCSAAPTAPDRRLLHPRDRGSLMWRVREGMWGRRRGWLCPPDCENRGGTGLLPVGETRLPRGTPACFAVRWPGRGARERHWRREGPLL